MRISVVFLFLSVSVVAQGFGVQTVIANEFGVNSVYAADLDGDGDADVLSASDGPFVDKIAWCENLGGGTFGPQQVISNSVEGAQSVHATDLDGDGDVDVLSASTNPLAGVHKIAWYENLGGGAFGVQRMISTNATGASSVYATDLDGDGDADVLYASAAVFFGIHKIAWFENLGGGSFSAEQVITTNASFASSAYATDLDGDGDADVLSSSRSDHKIAWYENLGGGVFGTQQVITTSANGAESVYATDLDGDGDADVLSASVADNKVAWYENQGGGAFGGQQVITTNAISANSVYATDLDGDGDADVLSASGSAFSNDGKIAWYENLGGGAFGGQQVLTTSASGAASVYATDLDGDGDADVLSASWTELAWYENLHDTWRCLTAQGTNGDVTIRLLYGQASVQYYMAHSPDSMNGTSPGTGILFGLHISSADLATQFTSASQGVPLFGGTLDVNGASSLTCPGPAVVFLSGQTWYSLGIQLNPTTAGLYEPTAITSITFQ